MRLTNTLRQAFVLAAMADVPLFDFDEQVQKLAQAKLDSFMPPALARVIALDKNNRSWISNEYIYLKNYNQGVYLYGSAEAFKRLYIDVELNQAVSEIRSKRAEQSKQHQDLRDKLKGTAASCTTRAQLLEALPEFEKYLPEAAAAPSKSLPALANLVSDFMAAGWPKQQAKPSAPEKTTPQAQAESAHKSEIVVA